MTHKRIEDFESDGFEIYDEDNPKPSADKGYQAPGETKIIVVDTKEVLRAVEATNMIVRQGMENSNRQLQSSIEKLVRTIGKKPESFTLEIKRDQRGFMTSVDVKINK